MQESVLTDADTAATRPSLFSHGRWTWPSLVSWPEKVKPQNVLQSVQAAVGFGMIHSAGNLSRSPHRCTTIQFAKVHVHDIYFHIISYTLSSCSSIGESMFITVLQTRPACRQASVLLVRGLCGDGLQKT